jgi:hypothetical protein
VIKHIEAEAESAGSIIIPDTVREKPQQRERGKQSLVRPRGGDSPLDKASAVTPASSRG